MHDAVHDVIKVNNEINETFITSMKSQAMNIYARV